MKCEGHYDLFVIFGGPLSRCGNDAKFAVQVSPDKTVHLCDFHNMVDYVGLCRRPLSQEPSL